VGKLWPFAVAALLLLSLVARMVPGGKRLEGLLRRAFWVCALAFFVWLTRGTFAVAAAIGFVLAFAVIMGVLVSRARPVNVARLPEVAKKMLRPALGFGLIVAAGIEIGGHWSGGPFVISQAILGAALVLFFGTIWVYRASHR
jgi:hypothetical protein